MSQTTRPGPDDSAARAFTRVGFPKLLPKLYRYATNTLRLAAIDANRAGVLEAADLVNTLVVLALAGRLSWVLGEDATEEQIVGFACTMLNGMLANFRKHAARSISDDALDELADEAPDAFTRLLEQRGMAEVMTSFAHDAEARAHLAMIFEGKTRTEIAATFGITVDHADVVRQRIRRGLTALRATMNDHTEPGPRRSGVRGTYHEPQATEERQGAAREPLGGAGRARGRR